MPHTTSIIKAFNLTTNDFIDGRKINFWTIHETNLPEPGKHHNGYFEYNIEIKTKNNDDDNADDDDDDNSDEENENTKLTTWSSRLKSNPKINYRGNIYTLSLENQPSRKSNNYKGIIRANYIGKNKRTD